MSCSTRRAAEEILDRIELKAEEASTSATVRLVRVYRAAFSDDPDRLRFLASVYVWRYAPASATGDLMKRPSHVVIPYSVDRLGTASLVAPHAHKLPRELRNHPADKELLQVGSTLEMQYMAT